MRFATQSMSLIQMDKELNKLNNMDKDLLTLRHDYEHMVKAINKNTETISDMNHFLNKLCTKLEKETVVVDNLEREMRRYQQVIYGVVIAVIVFFIEQVIMLIN